MAQKIRDEEQVAVKIAKAPWNRRKPTRWSEEGHPEATRETELTSSPYNEIQEPAQIQQSQKPFWEVTRSGTHIQHT